MSSNSSSSSSTSGFSKLIPADQSSYSSRGSKKASQSNSKPINRVSTLIPTDQQASHIYRGSTRAVLSSSKIDKLIKQLNKSISPPTNSIVNLPSRIENPPPPNNRIESFKKVTRYINPGDGKVISQRDLTAMIARKIEGIYSADSVTVNNVNYCFGGEMELVKGAWRERKIPARKIEIKRGWCLYDLVPLGVFLPTLLNTNSVYRKTIDTSSIRDFLLNAKLSETDVDVILKDTRSAIVLRNPLMPNLDNFEEVIKEKHRNDSEFIITDEDKISNNAAYNTDLEIFVNEYNRQYQELLDSGKKQLTIAYWKSKSLTIYLPVDLDDSESGQLSAYIEVPKDSGFATVLGIKMGSYLGFKKKGDYVPLNNRITIEEEKKQ